MFCGFFWALININSYPFVVQMADKSTIGAYTGFYYTASSIAAILSPVLLGAIINIFSYRYMFFYAVVFMILSLMLLLKVNNSGN
ncbi:MFS transporter [Clostridium sp. JN-9]|uniref:MFS transporter n=1 Tax=Clostridium sp. JN-9 TaxID=2507159 RepID=UPI00242C26A5|nr:MFS transporter [Clostridium sp. JN-9]